MPLQWSTWKTARAKTRKLRMTTVPYQAGLPSIPPMKTVPDQAERDKIQSSKKQFEYTILANAVTWNLQSATSSDQRVITPCIFKDHLTLALHPQSDLTITQEMTHITNARTTAPFTLSKKIETRWQDTAKTIGLREAYRNIHRQEQERDHQVSSFAVQFDISPHKADWPKLTRSKIISLLFGKRCQETSSSICTSRIHPQKSIRTHKTVQEHAVARFLERWYSLL